MGGVAGGVLSLYVPHEIKDSIDNQLKSARKASQKLELHHNWWVIYKYLYMQVDNTQALRAALISRAETREDYITVLIEKFYYYQAGYEEQTHKLMLAHISEEGSTPKQTELLNKIIDKKDRFDFNRHIVANEIDLLFKKELKDLDDVLVADKNKPTAGGLKMIDAEKSKVVELQGYFNLMLAGLIEERLDGLAGVLSEEEIYRLPEAASVHMNLIYLTGFKESRLSNRIGCLATYSTEGTLQKHLSVE
jgi:hypothetical protein